MIMILFLLNPLGYEPMNIFVRFIASLNSSEFLNFASKFDVNFNEYSSSRKQIFYLIDEDSLFLAKSSFLFYESPSSASKSVYSPDNVHLTPDAYVFYRKYYVKVLKQVHEA